MVSKLSEIWSLIRVFHLSRIPILGPGSRIQGWKRHRIPDPWSRTATRGNFGFALAVGGSVGYWHSTGAAVLTTHSIDQLWKRILRIFYFDTVSLIFPVFKLWWPAHLFPNTPRTYLTYKVLYICMGAFSPYSNECCWIRFTGRTTFTLVSSSVTFSHAKKAGA